MERCPACRARLAESPVCARCGCEVTLARRAEARAQRLGNRALRAWVDADRASALAWATESLMLRRGMLAQVVLKLLSRPPDGRA